MTELRDYPREVAGWVLAPASLAMAASTFLTTVLPSPEVAARLAVRRACIGASACVWWLSSIDNFTPKEHIALVLACWGACSSACSRPCS